MLVNALILLGGSLQYGYDLGDRPLSNVDTFDDIMDAYNGEITSQFHITDPRSDDCLGAGVLGNGLIE